MKINPYGTMNTSDETFFFWSKDPFCPLSANVLTKRFNQALTSIGISERTRKNTLLFLPQSRYAYVQNDPVNFRDLFGLSVSDKTKTIVVINRPNTDFGDSFSSTRTIIKTNKQFSKITYNDYVGANAASEQFAQKHNGMTLPDGRYYLTTEGLSQNDDGTWDSASYHNVLRLQTNDPNIPKEIRDEINSDYFLFHANQFKNKDIPYNEGTKPRSAGCIVSENGQTTQDHFMQNLISDSAIEDIDIYIISNN